MGAPIGFIWFQAVKRYKEDFGEPPPEWLKHLSLAHKTRLVSVSRGLRWPLPDVCMPEEFDIDWLSGE